MITIEELEIELNGASFKRTSKDNNKNNLRIRSYLNEKYPDLSISFHNDKHTGVVKVLKVRTKEEEQEAEERHNAAEIECAKQRKKESNFYKKAKTPSGKEMIMNSIANKLEKSGYQATVKSSRSCVASISFYIEIDTPEELEETHKDIEIKVSDHYTNWQQAEHPETWFINISEIGGTKNLHARIREIINKEWGI